MSENKADPLLPCPFCGKPAAICCLDDEPGSPISFWVGCGSCGIETRERRIEQEAIAIWNTRTDPQPAAPLGGREEIAAWLIAREESLICEPGNQIGILQGAAGQPVHAVNRVPAICMAWARSKLANGMRSKHSGDCTKESHSCQRCNADHALRDADAILAIIPQERGVERAAIIEECVKAAESIEMGRKWSDDPDMQNQGYYTEGEILVEVVDSIRALAGKETER